MTRLLSGLSEFIADADVRRLSSHLVQQAAAGKAARTSYESQCELTRTPRSVNAYRIDFVCSAQQGAAGAATLNGRLYIEGRAPVHGSIDRVTLSDDARRAGDLRDVDLARATVEAHGERRKITAQLTRGGMQARRADGNALNMLQLVWDEPARGAPGNAVMRGRATLSVIHDFAPLHTVVENMVRETAAGKLDVFSKAPFRRASVLPVLFERAGMKPLAWCCVSDAGMPMPIMEGATTAATAKAEADAKPLALQPFFRYCATCHQSNDRTPPNFLQGSASAVAANLAHCAQRLYVRLSMWQLPVEHRAKTPMPPPLALYAFHTAPQQWRDSAELTALRTYAERVLQAEAGKPPRAEDLIAKGYENLRPCLPEAN
jgi:mono/diheme cytochrome c family protein